MMVKEVGMVAVGVTKESMRTRLAGWLAGGVVLLWSLEGKKVSFGKG